METINELSFEQAYEQLQATLEQLESGELSLEDMVAITEKGKLLSARCQTLLDNAELRIKKINDAGVLSD